ncbi:MAG: hypothetical protein KDG50_02205 [Chromatiales bacterium]|nr:hypothetical protein [Chromatiales bacterium]
MLRFSAGFRWLAWLLVFLGSPLHATTITATYNGTIAGGQVQRIISDSTTGSTGWTNLGAGLFSMTVTGGDFAGDLLPSGSANFLAFCVEPQQGVSTGQTYTWEVLGVSSGANNIGGMGAVRAGYVGELLGGVYPVFGATTLTNQQALAIQIAIWEIVRETVTAGGFVVANGAPGAGNTRFRSESVAGAIALAQSWLDLYVNDLVTGPQATGLYSLVNATQQDLIAQIQLIPAPTSELLLAAGLLAFASRRRLQADSKR